MVLIAIMLMLFTYLLVLLLTIVRDAHLNPSIDGLI